MIMSIVPGDIVTIDLKLPIDKYNSSYKPYP